MNKILLQLSLLLFISVVFSQQEVNQKNLALKQKEVQLRELKNNSKKQQHQATYNLGNTIYKSKQYNEAKQNYKLALSTAKTKAEKHKAYHNLGNVYMREKKYDKAVDSYKNALKNNPKDEETRYNLAVAQRKLKQNPSPKNKPKNKDKKQPKNNKDKNKNSQKNKNNKSQSKPKGTNKQRMENILNAIGKEEKRVQEKANAQRGKTQTLETDKDW